MIIWALLDNPILVQAQSHMHQKLSPKAITCGDHAFHGCFGVVVPYSHSHIEAGDGASKRNFNYNHSSDRMCSEHGVMFMKLWGVVRGRSDVRLYENDEIYYAAVRSCWALHNFKYLDGPLF